MFLTRAVLFSVALGLASAPVAAESAESRGTLSFVFENDGIFSDRNYTSGILLSYLSGDRGPSGPTRWLGRHLLFADPEDRTRFGIAIGQSIFAPKDSTLSAAPPDQHPYAGWLYGALSLVVESEHTLDTLSLELGVVGPSALGEHSQLFVHRLLSIEEPRGWEHQLHDEFAAALHFDRKWRLFSDVRLWGLEFDLTPSLGFSAGNVISHAGAGVVLRLGNDLRNDFGPPRVRPALAGSGLLHTRDELGGYFFLGAAGRAVAFDIFLDGNTSGGDPEVDRRPLVADLQAGFAIQIDFFQAGVTVVLRTSEFEEQTQPDIFSSLFVSVRL